MPPHRRQFLQGAAGMAALGWFGLAGSACGGVRGRTQPRAGGGFREWSLISRREELFALPRIDVVVVGSGYGGAVSAARLASAGAKVAVLERGREWLPGDFPEDLSSFTDALRARHAAGLFDLYTPAKSDLDVISASGVGGTSLINAAISIRPEPLVFAQREWPEAIRAAASDGTLWPYFERAESVLQPQFYVGPIPQKVETLRAMAEQRHRGAGLLPLNVSYEAALRGDPNRRVPMRACELCGNCTTGCNAGAKGTLQTNYLPRAVAAGARIFADVEVNRVEPWRGRWRVHYASDTEHGRDTRFIECDHVVLAAGSLGSTEIMMRSADRGLRVSDALGTRLSPNGDLMGFCYNGDAPTNLIGEPLATASQTVGNALMGYVDYRGDRALGPDLQDRFLLLEGTIPAALANATAKALALLSMTFAGDLGADQQGRILRDVIDANEVPPDGALAYSTLYLACGHDDSHGRYVYRRGGRPQTRWDRGRAAPFYRTILAEMAQYTKQRGGHFLENPRTALFGGRLVVPHPLGGCPMGETIADGVVDHVGGVFAPAGGTHRGLKILDGSIIPRSLGATPLLTITALAERATEIGQTVATPTP